MNMQEITDSDLARYKTQYENEGFLVVRGFLGQDDVEKCKSVLSAQKAVAKVPFSNQAWGFGNLLEIEELSFVRDSSYLRQILQHILAGGFEWSHFLGVNKVPWQGPDVEWHQEVFNFQIYASGLDPNLHWDRFSQIFIALDPQKSENGCLQVIPRAHKEGVLTYEDIVNSFFNHKRRIPHHELNRLISQGYCIKAVEMAAGDVLIFNHLLPHGSASNISGEGRLALLLQAFDNKLRFDDQGHKEYSDFRMNFVREALKQKLEKIDENLYASFKK